MAPCVGVVLRRGCSDDALHLRVVGASVGVVPDCLSVPGAADVDLVPMSSYSDHHRMVDTERLREVVSMTEDQTVSHAAGRLLLDVLERLAELGAQFPQGDLVYSAVALDAVTRSLAEERDEAVQMVEILRSDLRSLHARNNENHARVGELQSELAGCEANYRRVNSVACRQIAQKNRLKTALERIAEHRADAVRSYREDYNAVRVIAADVLASIPAKEDS